jgi:hypothetical protein
MSTQPHDTLFHNLAKRVASEPEQAVRVQTQQGDDLIVLDRQRYTDLLAKALAWDGLTRDDPPTRMDPDAFLDMLND